MNMNKEDREKLLDVAGFLQGWLAFKKPVPPDEVVRLHFDLVMEVLAKNNEVLDLVSKSFAEDWDSKEDEHWDKVQDN